MELTKEHYWGNLGYWQSLDDYLSAAIALAKLVGDAARLNQHQKVLDLGSGYGAQLHLWKSHYQVESIQTFEPDKAASKHAQGYIAGSDISGISWLPSAESAADDLDAVVSVDAAYHIPNRRALWQSLVKRLKPNGRLALTDLVLFEHAHTRTHPLHRVSSIFEIPAENLMTQHAYREELEGIGFKNVEFRDLSSAVFGGFARNWKSVLRAHQGRPDASWLKYKLTALAVSQALRWGTPRYVLISADKIRA